MVPVAIVWAFRVNLLHRTWISHGRLHPRSASACTCADYLLLRCLPPGCAPSPCATRQGRFDAWDTAYLGDGKAGYVHTIAREIESRRQDCHPDHHRIAAQRQAIERHRRGRRTPATIETAMARCVGVFMRHYLAKQQNKQWTASSSATKFTSISTAISRLKPNPWNPAVLGQLQAADPIQGPQRQARGPVRLPEFRADDQSGFEGGSHGQGLSRHRRRAWRRQKRRPAGGDGPGKNRVQGNAAPTSLETIQLPVNLIWLDDQLEPVKSEVEVPGSARSCLIAPRKLRRSGPGPRRATDRHRHQPTRAAQESDSEAV